MEEMNGKQVPFGELFPRSFMIRYTDSENIEEFFENSSWDIESEEDFEAIPEVEMDQHVDDHSRFRTWEQMMSKGGEEYVTRQLGFQ